MSVERVTRDFLNSEIHVFLLKQDSLILGSTTPPISDLSLGRGLAPPGAVLCCPPVAAEPSAGHSGEGSAQVPRPLVDI